MKPRVVAASAGLVIAALGWSGCGSKPFDVAIAVTPAGYLPKQVEVPRGRPVTIVFTRSVEQTCATDVVFPTLHRGFDLPYRTPVRVRLAAGEVGDSLPFNCSTKLASGMLVAR